jgi:hypothetical protein
MSQVRITSRPILPLLTLLDNPGFFELYYEEGLTKYYIAVWGLVILLISSLGLLRISREMQDQEIVALFQTFSAIEIVDGISQRAC